VTSVGRGHTTDVLVFSAMNFMMNGASVKIILLFYANDACLTLWLPCHPTSRMLNLTNLTAFYEKVYILFILMPGV